jgi:hypothetical protein
MNRTQHIDNGQYVLESGVESKHLVENKDGTQYIIKNKKCYKSKKNKISITYIGD